LNPLFEHPLAIVDLETTGADPNRDRITEVAILRIDGGRLVERWSSLIDPERPIPPRIQEVTGISDAMVAHAPNFRALADEIAERLADAVFVAHNARFDFNFLRAAFGARGMPFDPAVLCSVKFSRALYPQHARHGLDAIIQRHGYTIANRHRAMADAEIVWRFLQECVASFEPARIEAALKRASSSGRAVPKLPLGDLEALPEAPGVYIFLNGADKLVDIGHTQHLRSKVLGCFTGKPDTRTARIVAQTKRVEIALAAGSLDAHLRELELTRRYQANPVAGAAFGWRFLPNRRRGPVLILDELTGSDPAQWQQVFGCFRGQREAENALRELALLNRLCPQRLGLEQSNGACQAYGLHRCNGVCVEHESAGEHDARLLTALRPLRLKPWPWNGPIAISEIHTASGTTALHVFDRWCLLGSVHDHTSSASPVIHGGASETSVIGAKGAPDAWRRSPRLQLGAIHETSADDLLANLPPRRFDLEAYRLFARWLAQPGHMQAVKELGVSLQSGGDA